MSSTIAAKSKQLPPGVYVPVVSLYKDTPRQEIDLDAAYKHFTHLIRGGIHGIVLAGTNAEAVLLSPSDRQELIRIARKAATDLGVPDYPLVAGTSGQSTNESIQLAEEAAQAGAGWALLLPPSYWAKAVTKDVILGFYREVADHSPIPVVIYSVRIPFYQLLHANKSMDRPSYLTLAKFPVSRRYKRGRYQLRRHVRTCAAPQHRGHQAHLRQRR